MDQSRGVPLLVVVLALLAAVGVPRLVPGPGSPPAQDDEDAAITPPATTSGPAKTGAATPEELAQPGWTAPLRLYREFFGLVSGEKRGTVSDLLAVRARAAAADDPHLLETVVALVPDPVDSNLAANFDQAVEAIQIATADYGYLLDRLWLPWTGNAAKANLYRETPGLMLFRRRAPSGPRRLLAVYLVGETPKQGAHKRALGAALELAGGLTTAWPLPEAPAGPDGAGAGAQAAAEGPTKKRPVVRILGPSFSGSAPSLRRALYAWGGAPVGGAPAPAVTFRVVTGSATASGLEEQFAGIAGSFERTVIPDDELQRCAFGFLEERLGWEPDKVALLAEADTAYGRQEEEEEPAGQRPAILAPAAGPAGPADPCPEYRRPPGSPEPQRLNVWFPSGLASLRSAWEQDEATSREAAAKGKAVAVPKGALGLSLADQSKPVDIVPQFSDLSLASHDLALSNLLDSIWRGGIRYVGILSTDVRDKLFLAERIRRFAPDMVIFTLDNNLLYAHPQHSAALDGTLVLSSFPLATESERWRHVFAGPPGTYRRQFTSEFQQGIFFAAEKLLGYSVPQPRAWIAAVGNGSLWPVASFPPATVGFEELAGRGDLQLLLLAALLCLLALWLSAVYPPVQMYEGTGRFDLTAHRLLAAGCAVLAVLGGVLAVLGTLPIWASGRKELAAAFARDPVFKPLYLAALALAYGFLVWSAARATSRPSPSGREDEAAGRRARRITLAWALAGLLLLPALALLMRRYWMAGGTAGGEELFYLRARKLSSGLSPILSLLLLGGSIYAWVLMELKRRRLIARQAIPWPLPRRLEPPLEGVRTIAKPVFKLMGQTFPHAPWSQSGRRAARWRQSFLYSPVPGNGKRAARRRRASAFLSRPGRSRRAAQGRWFWIALALLLLPPAVMLLRTVQPICEARGYGLFFLALAVLAFALATVSFFQFFALWLDLDRLLQRLDHTRLVEAFRKVSDEVAWSPMRAFGWRPPSFKMTTLSADSLRPLLVPAAQRAMREHLEALFRADQAGDLAAETRARRDLDRLFAEASAKLAGRSDQPPVEQFFALRLVAFLRPVVAHMRNCLAASLVATLFLLFAVRSYAFEPQWFVSMGIWAALGIGVAVTLWIFVQMDRNASLSAIGGTPAGKVTFDRHFYLNVLTYGAIPVAGIVVTQFPQIGRYVASWVNPVLRVAGGQ